MLLLGLQHSDKCLLLQGLGPGSTRFARSIGTWEHSFSRNLAGISDFNFTFAHNHTPVALLQQAHIAMAAMGVPEACV